MVRVLIHTRRVSCIKLAACAVLPLASVLSAPRLAKAANSLVVLSTKLDPPTLVALGVQVLISDDDNFNATIGVRYRVAGTTAWRDGLPLYRVHPESVVGRTVPAQFAGSVFDLLPATNYEIELHATDADGPVDKTWTVTGTTRAVPKADPATPKAVNVGTATELRAALNAAAAGDVITLADGTYSGEFSIDASGTADNPIVIRGTTRDGTILDGGNAGANVFEIYGSYVHLERLTLQHDNRALRFQGAATVGNVVRRVHIRDVTLGVGSKPDQRDFYLCDNFLEGRLLWPAVYRDDGGLHANDDGIELEGNGHVVCHNQIHGFGDAFKLGEDGTRVFDFYGNEVTTSYDNGIEFDGGEGNLRCFRNRFTNTYATLSFQPVFGGPAYAVRNVIVNVADEQMKLHALGGTPPLEPSGILVYHNTFVSPAHAIQLSTADQVHHFYIANNLFIGPAAPTNGDTVNWDAPIDVSTAHIDYNGYYPDGQFRFGYGTNGVRYANFAAVVAGGRYEAHGLVLASVPFASGLSAGTSYTTAVPLPDAALSSDTIARDAGLRLANINDGYTGKGPDLGALEAGCTTPLYGIRPDGTDESNEPTGCASGAGGNGTGGNGNAGAPNGSAGTGPSGGATSSTGGAAGNVGAAGTAGASASSSKGGCGCRLPASDPTDWRSPTWLILALAGLLRRRRGA